MSVGRNNKKNRMLRLSLMLLVSSLCIASNKCSIKIPEREFNIGKIVVDSVFFDHVMKTFYRVPKDYVVFFSRHMSVYRDASEAGVDTVIYNIDTEKYVKISDRGV